MAGASVVVCHGQVCRGVGHSQPPEEGLICHHPYLILRLSILVATVSPSVVLLLLLSVAVALVVAVVITAVITTAIIVIITTVIIVIMTAVVSTVVPRVVSTVVPTVMTVVVSTIVTVVVTAVMTVVVTMVVSMPPPLLLVLGVSSASPVLLLLLVVAPSPLCHIKALFLIPVRHDGAHLWCKILHKRVSFWTIRGETRMEENRSSKEAVTAKRRNLTASSCGCGAWRALLAC